MNNDASDADIQVLERQIANCEPLSEDERDHVIQSPELKQSDKHL